MTNEVETGLAESHEEPTHCGKQYSASQIKQNGFGSRRFLGI
jgi:hypothetical protein